MKILPHPFLFTHMDGFDEQEAGRWWLNPAMRSDLIWMAFLVRFLSHTPAYTYIYF